jgi:hypothetical protein
MKLLAALVFAFFIPLAAQAADAGKPDAAAAAWLALVDAGNYGASWSQSSALMQGHVTQAQWQAAAGSARGPLGSVVTRNVTSVKTTDTLPGVPDGHYAVITYATTFAHKASATETVTMVDDGDAWKTAGYFIR